MARKKKAITDPRALRLKLGLNQAAFWNPIGVTQSGASRYENGRRLPPPVALLLGHVYGRRPVPVYVD